MSQKSFLNRKSALRLALTSAISIVAGVVIGILCTRENSPELTAYEQDADSIFEDSVEALGVYEGRIHPQHAVEVRARVEGYLARIVQKDGSYIQSGQTLFVIDPTKYQAQYNKALAQFNKAKAIAVKAKRDLDRIRPLYEANAASQLDLDNAVAAYEGATADVAVCEADLTQAQLTLDNTVVKSPVEGYVTQSNSDIGTLVGPSAQSLLATVVKIDTMRVDFSMSSSEFRKCREFCIAETTEGMRIVASIINARGKHYPYKGYVDFSDPRVDPKTGIFTLFAEIPNPDHLLQNGELITVRLEANCCPPDSVSIKK